MPTNNERTIFEDLSHSVVAKPVLPSPPLVRTSGTMTGKVLTTATEVNAAKRLLHETYIVELNWKFADDNSTGFKIVSSETGKMLTDKWDAFSHWFGVFEGTELISCARLLEQDAEGNLDMSLYKDHQCEATQAALEEHIDCKTMELQRHATSSKHRGYGAQILGVALAIEFAHRRNANIIVSTPSDRIAVFLNECQWKEIGDKFDYGDGVATRLFHADNDTLPHAADMFNGVLEHYSKKKEKNANDYIY